MKYKVIQTMKIKDNTAVTIDGGGERLHNGIIINNGRHKVLSVGMSNSKDIGRRTTVLIEGIFSDREIEVN